MSDAELQAVRETWEKAHHPFMIYHAPIVLDLLAEIDRLRAENFRLDNEFDRATRNYATAKVSGHGVDGGQPPATEVL